MYAIVRAGGRQEKVAVGDVVQIDKIDGEPGSSITLPALLVVDGETVTSDAKALAGVTVTAEVVGAVKGPKITIMKFKNKTGYRKRQGHRQKYTEVKVTDGSQRGSEKEPWHTRRARPRRATVVTRTRSDSASSASAARSSTPARSSSGSAARTSTQAATSVAVATTRSSRLPAGAVEFGTRRGRRVVNIVSAE